MKRKSSKTVQVNLGICESDEELDIDITSEKYWNLVAEKKRVQLSHALEKNEMLHKLKENLKQQNLKYKQMLMSVKAFIDEFKEVVQDTIDNTAIDDADRDSSAD